jgi:hypothetical protein
MKGINNYEGSTNELVLISGPNCDNEQGYVYGEYTILWQNDIFILYGAENCWPNLNKKEHVKIKRLINRDTFEVVYTKIFGRSAYPLIEKAIDEDGWYCSEKNDRWLQVEPHNMSLLQFRNGNKDLRPLELSQ